ncbi:MAG: hypothetical protein AB1646_01440 [Thermodesulfobacteriota bacterium]
MEGAYSIDRAVHWLGVVGSVASLVGLLISGLVWRDVRRIRAFFLARARVPELIRAIQMHMAKLERCLEAYERSRTDFHSEMARTRGTLANLAPKLPRHAKKEVHAFLNALHVLSRGASKEEVRRVFDRLVGLLASVTQLEKDMKWSR